MRKKGVQRIDIFILMLLLIVVLYFGRGDIFRLTGMAQSSLPTNLSITVSGPNVATITFVSSIPNTDPTEINYKTITFYMTMKDEDGAADLNDTSIAGNFTGGSTTRDNSTCKLVEDSNTTAANYSCAVDMWYWDASGSWSVGVRGNDLGNGTFANNKTRTFTYNQLKAMAINITSLTWPSVNLGGTNQASNNDPTGINNTGNYNGQVSVTAVGLLGVSTPSEVITASNFTISSSSGSECTGTAMVNGTATAVSGSASNPGNLSAGGGVGQEELYYCIANVPGAGKISSQTYSTSQGGSWTIAY